MFNVIRTVCITTYYAYASSGQATAMCPAAAQATALAVASRQRVFPRWLLPLTAAFALQQLVETVTIFGEHGFIAPGGGLNQLGVAFFGVWVIAQGAAASRAA
jgi:hypothetical protein